MKIPAHSNCVATLPCKIFGTFTHSGRFSHFWDTLCIYACKDMLEELSFIGKVLRLKAATSPCSQHASYDVC